VHLMKKNSRKKNVSVQRANVFDLFSMAEPEPIAQRRVSHVSPRIDGGIGPVLQCSPGQENIGGLGIRFAEHHEIGKRPTMEDQSVMIGHVGSDVWADGRGRNDVAFFGVYDGHGGKECAIKLRDSLHHYIFGSQHFPSDVEQAIMEGCENCDRRECNMSPGSTAVFCIMMGGLLWFGNVGDSEAVLSVAGRAECVTLPHRPSMPSEEKRIKAAGGFVRSGRVMGLLAVSRAFGDVDSKCTRSKAQTYQRYTGDFVIAEPYVRSLDTVDRVEGDEIEFIILACDGLFDVMEYQESVDFVRDGLRSHGDIDRAARELVQHALFKRTTDNVSVMIICLGQH
jgi:protein phosphatase 2C family protein 2/3